MWVYCVIGLVLAVLVLFSAFARGTASGTASGTPTGTDDCRVLSTRVLEDGTRLEIVADDCKEGLPHTTTSTTMRMTQSIADSPRFHEIMTHERVHLDQKTRPDYWRSLVKRIWAYDLYETAPQGVPADVVAKLRPNPDTDAAPWAVWRGRYVFFPAYGDDKRLSTAKARIWDLEEGRLTEEPPEWRAQFCFEGACPHQWEHPYEIAAEYKTHPSQCSAAAALFAE